MNGISLHAHKAIKELGDIDHLNGIIRGCIWDPQLGHSERHPNATFFGEVEWYLSCRQIAHAGDTFNTYCQCILAEIIHADAAQWDTVKKLLRSKTREEAILRLRKQGEADTLVREALRDKFKVLWCNEIEIICELRNKVVHQAGLDPEGKVLQKAGEFPPGKHPIQPPDLPSDDFPVACATDGRLLIDARSAHWATRFVQHHIHLMDQTICHRFGVAQVSKPMPGLSFRMRNGAHPQLLLPGTPLPKPPEPKLPSPAPPLPKLPIIEPTISSDEKSCASTWREIKSQLYEWVRATCEAAGIQIQTAECNVAGNPLPHTLTNHEIHIGYQLTSTDPSSTKSNFIGIRIRQNHFVPFVTLWSTKTMMRDFPVPAELDQLKEAIRTAIHATVS